MKNRQAFAIAIKFAWGDDDGKPLYLGARTGLYRIRLNVAGVRPPLRLNKST